MPAPPNLPPWDDPAAAAARAALFVGAGVGDCNDLRGLFGPGSMAWRVLREHVLFLAAYRALVHQVAHPAVAQGVVDHSAYRTAPVARLRGTLQSLGAIAFGSRAEA
jgi:uncharacterized protein (DUF2236 family)